MKSLLEFKTIVEEEKSDYSKFDVLVRAGLANKAQMQRIHKILDKMHEEKPQFNNADKMILQNLFNKMVDLISNNKAINMQARRAVKEDEDVIEAEQLDEANPGPTPPYVLLLKRTAIRLYPDGTKIALYYNKQLKKYFSVPYDTPVSSAIQAEEVEHLDEIGDPAEMYRKATEAAKAKLQTMKALDKTREYEKKRLEAAKLKTQKEEVVSEMAIGKKKPKSDTHHIVDKEGKTLSLAAYLDKASAVKDLQKHPGGKVVTLGPRGKVKEEVEITEAVMDQLHKIVNDKQAQSVKFASGHTRKIDHFTASALTQVHKALNDENKKKFADLVHKSPEHFQKASDFAFKHAK